MGIHFRSRAGAGPDPARDHPEQVWRPSAGRPSGGDTAPRVGAVLAALAIVALLTAGLHVLFR
jgi:hypothetical protein